MSMDENASFDMMVEVLKLVDRANAAKATDACWCGSGDTFAQCHSGRENEPQANFHDYAKRSAAAARRGTCLFPLASGGLCGVQAIASHTVQRRGGLAAIAEDGHVMRTLFTFGQLLRTNGQPNPERIGLKEASTFPGFCSKHDTLLFKPIEGKSLSMDPQAAFLFGYRATCLELARKQWALDEILKSRRLDAGMNVEHQAHSQVQLGIMEEGTRISLDDLHRRKMAADASYRAGDWSTMNFCQVSFDVLLPVVTAAAFLPEYDWAGLELQDILALKHGAAEISLTVTSYGGKSIVVFTWSGSALGVQRDFVESYLRIPDAEKASRLVAACFELSENTFVRQTWWAALPEEAKDQTRSQIMHGTTQSVHPREGLASSAPIPADCKVTEVATSWV